jgi:4-hydroxy-tetrahydrodipicolinate reductase
MRERYRDKMTRIILRGCNGRMGQVITELLKNDDQAEIVAGVDIYETTGNGYPVYTSFSACKTEADVIIDFASPDKMDKMLQYSEKNNVPIVLCTTGLSPDDQKNVEKTSKKVAIFRSANMSLGCNILAKVLKSITAVLAESDFDIEIVEKHHNQKLDAPSGTALMLADVMNEALDQEYSYKYDRSGDHVKRPKKEIGISAVRGGTIVGEHEIIFAGIDEVIEFKHTAYSRAIFAKGAIQAAKYMNGKPAGMYQMSDVIG